MPGAVAVGPLGARRCADEGWDDQALTEQQLADLAAWDRAGDPAGEQWLGLLPDEDLDGGAAGPEVLAGLTPRRWGTEGGFGAGGVADRVPPGPALSGLAADKHDAGLASASDDELAGLMIAWRRIASWAAAGELAAVAELDRRRAAQAAATGDARLAEHVSDEVAMVLTLTFRAADKLTGFAASLARLPRTWAALRGGDIDVPKALAIADELAGLDRPHAVQAEAAVLGRAARQTTGELRRAARRAVLDADPTAARARKEKAVKDARVECWQEHTGTAALAGRDLPPADVLAADRQLTAYARQLKTAGADGTLDQLRAQVYLALLNGQPVDSLLPFSEPRSAATGPAAGDSTGKAGLAADASRSPGPAARGSSNPGPAAPDSINPSPAAPDSINSSPAAPDSINPGRAARGSINLVVPLAAWLGWDQQPGEVAGFGPLDAADSRALADALARDPATTWCLTLTGPSGRPVAHGCATTGPGQPPGAAQGPPGRAQTSPGPGPPDPAGRSAKGNGPGPPGRSAKGNGPGPPPPISDWLAGITLAWLETGSCAHRRESAGYRPTPALTHLIHIRHQTCAAPGCRRPATACDFEHTVAYQQGGRTCECNGAPVCRRHHRAKQAPGWHVQQTQPGTLAWTLPNGRSSTTHPAEYPA